nr:hypothetical protein [Salinispora mooreana]
MVRLVGRTASVLVYMEVDLLTDPAALLSLLMTAVANTAANRRLTFGITMHHRRGG